MAALNEIDDARYEFEMSDKFNAIRDLQFLITVMSCMRVIF